MWPEAYFGSLEFQPVIETDMGRCSCDSLVSGVQIEGMETVFGLTDETVALTGDDFFGVGGELGPHSTVEIASVRTVIRPPDFTEEGGNAREVGLVVLETVAGDVVQEVLGPLHWTRRSL